MTEPKYFIAVKADSKQTTVLMHNSKSIHGEKKYERRWGRGDYEEEAKAKCTC